MGMKEDLPFGDPSESKEEPSEKKEENNCIDNIYEMWANEDADYKRVIYNLMDTIDILFRDLLYSDLEVVKWRESLIKHLHPICGKALREDILDNLHSANHYMDDPGFAYYVKHYGRENLPLTYANSIHGRELYRMMNGTSSASDVITYGISMWGGEKMFKDAMQHVYDSAMDLRKDGSGDGGLKQSLEELEKVIDAYDRECSYLHGLRESFLSELDVVELAAVKMKEEVLFLYRVLRDNGVMIPIEGHPISLQPFADSNDPSREDYTGEYEVPDWLIIHTEGDFYVNNKE